VDALLAILLDFRLLREPFRLLFLSFCCYETCCVVDTASCETWCYVATKTDSRYEWRYCCVFSLDQLLPALFSFGMRNGCLRAVQSCIMKDWEVEW
jgi:hypothetical protein